MNRDYFENVRGTGVLSTSDGNGRVNSALYARPHVFDDDTVGFIMADRLSRANLHSNPHASYLFLEEGEGFRVGMATLDRLRPTVAAAACGMAGRALAEALAHAGSRVQFGEPLGSFQLI